MPRISSLETKVRKPRAKKIKPAKTLAADLAPVSIPVSPPIKKSKAKKTPKQKPTTKNPRAKKTIPVAQAPISTSAPKENTAPLPVAGQKKPVLSTPLPATKKTCMSSAQCFVYGGLICLVGTIVLGLFLGFIVLAPLGTRMEQAQETPQTQTNPQAQAINDLENTISQSKSADTQNSNGFYGTLLSSDKGVLMVKEINPSLPLEKKSASPEPKTFAVRVSDKTGYTYQRPRDEKDVSAPLFAPEDGKLENLKTGMYVFVATSDDTTKTETINASHILYSEKSPFAQ